MSYDDLLAGASKTAQAPTVQQANPTTPPKKSPNALSLEEFMRRNPDAVDLDAVREKRDKDKVKQAQKNQDRRGRPKVRETARSKRAKASKGAIDLARSVEQNIINAPTGLFEAEED